jgi:multidrug efflux pump subunit AcrA (membrane-fusion protein)
MRSRIMRRALVIGLAGVVACVRSDGDVQSDPLPSGPNSADSAWATVRPAADATLLEAPAHVVVHPDAVAEIAPTYRLHVERVLVRPGDVVAAGDVILEGTAPDLLDAAATLRATSAQAEILSARRARLAQLREEGLIEQSRVFELDVALAEVEGQRLRAAATLRAAGYSTAEAARWTKSSSSHIALTTPISGTVRSVDAIVGQMREPNAGAMVSIVGQGPSRIQARLAGPVPPGARFELVVHGGEVVDLGDAPPTTLVVPEDGTTLAWWDPPGEGLRLQPGLRGRVRGRVVDPDLREVPSAALRVVDGRISVLRVDESGETESVPVEVVASSGTSAIVRGPLELGDRVAADVSRVLPPPEVAE